VNLPGFAQHVANGLCLVGRALPTALDMDGEATKCRRAVSAVEAGEAGGAVESRSP